MTRKIIALILLVAVWGTQSLTAVSQNNDTYYTYVYYDGHYMYSIDEIDCDAIVKEWNCSSDYKIIAWKPIAPYQPKGE